MPFHCVPKVVEARRQLIGQFPELLGQPRGRPESCEPDEHQQHDDGDGQRGAFEDRQQRGDAGRQHPQEDGEQDSAEDQQQSRRRVAQQPERHEQTQRDGDHDDGGSDQRIGGGVARTDES